jgi:uncharacterized integral membrane protein
MYELQVHFFHDALALWRLTESLEQFKALLDFGWSIGVSQAFNFSHGSEVIQQILSEAGHSAKLWD